ncbi:hypothetical protein EKO04_003873 [Ascochyta lentis]|uniref:Uncharacterized protein n=1 Tax=Ascochyta lentis TaxID=205686 RepID=A0A8H7MIW6_9PLEO|nr:hypothetical protein EKO04_003873 [Ascochyta lentis]
MICETLNSSQATSSQPLRLSHPYFYHNTPRPKTMNSAALKCLENSQYGREKSLYACFECNRLRHVSKFGFDSPDQTEPSQLVGYERFCADCGFKGADAGPAFAGLPYLRKSIYWLGTVVWVGGVRWLWCFRCDKVKKGPNELLDMGSDESWCICRKCHVAVEQCRMLLIKSFEKVENSDGMDA